MPRLRLALVRLMALFTRRSRDRRLGDEIADHLQSLEEVYRARGLSATEAAVAARREFGGVDRVVEAHRDLATFRWLEYLRADTVAALRRTRREPWLALGIAASLSIGLGVAALVFGVVRAINFSAPPFDDPGAIVVLGAADPARRLTDVRHADAAAWREQSRSFTGMSAYTQANAALGDTLNAAESVAAAWVGANTFTVLGVRPLLGRDFVAQDDAPGAPAVALIGERLWRERFASDPAMAGRVVRADGVVTTVIGVLPADVTFPLVAQLWRPLRQMPGLTTDGAQSSPVSVVARLGERVTRAEAAAELLAIDARLPAGNSGSASERRRPAVVPFVERYLGTPADPPPLALMIAAGLVLLVACATAATLLYARSASRADEVALRFSLGASRTRLMSQLLIESAVLAVAAAAVAAGAAQLGLRTFADELSGAGMPPWVRFTLDRWSLAFLVTTAVVATGFGGAMPAWRLSAARRTTAAAAGGRVTQRRIRALLAVEVATTLVLLSAASLLVRSAWAMREADAAVRTDGVVTARLVVGTALRAEANRGDVIGRFAERLRARGELTHASLTSAIPFTRLSSRSFLIDGLPLRGDGRTVKQGHVDSSYFDLLGLSVVQGRVFTDGDGGTNVAVVNQRLATMIAPSGVAIGQRLRLGPSAAVSPDGPWLTVIGVVPSIRHDATVEPDPAVYLPLPAPAPTQIGVFVMARGRPGVAVADILRAEAGAVNPDLSLDMWRSLDQWSAISRWTQRTLGAVALVVGALTLILAGLGVYAVTAYAAAQRVKEAGIRAAVGASTADLTRLFVRGALVPAAIGVALGSGGAMAAARALRGLLGGLAASEAAAIVPVTFVVALVTVAAALLPARRVAAQDPLVALRRD